MISLFRPCITTSECATLLSEGNKTIYIQGLTNFSWLNYRVFKTFRATAVLTVENKIFERILRRNLLAQRWSYHIANGVPLCYLFVYSVAIISEVQIGMVACKFSSFQFRAGSVYFRILFKAGITPRGCQVFCQRQPKTTVIKAETKTTNGCLPFIIMSFSVCKVETPLIYPDITRHKVC